MRLTPQQQAVVNHTYGPALVFAVAGAGKTTALEQRIVRLVREGIFAPERILAAAYNTAVKEEMGARLRRQRGCGEVAVMTLHALGLRAVRFAYEAGLLPQLKRSAFQETESAPDALLLAALAEARRLKTPYVRELDNLDRTDFFTWLSGCKGNLLYPDLATIAPVLRKSGRAQQAAAPLQTPWYLPFAQLMEQMQSANGLITFDDQLRLGWEVLVSHPTILKRLQQSYDCVLVDEFQDVNLAQYLILELITAPRPDKPQRNYMVVGDDDQTIYEWRGARPNFILNFEKEYQATRYVMSENFRCPAGPLALANQVIRHNQKRYEKTLHLTQGFGGTTSVVRSSDRRQMGQSIVANIRTLLAQGDRLPDMAVLVRTKAQTPPVELALIQAQIPYRVVGSEPFYARWEVTTLIAYCRLALFEQQLQKGKRLSAAEIAQLVESWEAVYRHPKRYISQNEGRQISETLGRTRKPITETLRAVTIADKPYVQTRLGELATLLEWLSRAFAEGRGVKSAHAMLQELEKRLGYCAYLESLGTRSEAGMDEAENVKQFIEEAKAHGTLKEYLVYLKQLREQQAAQQEAAGSNLLTVRTIHSAKGLEWKVVIIPSCDDGNIPHRKSENVEEERRLLYVAITRSRRDLYIYHLAPKPSEFLTQANWATVVRAVTLMRGALGKPPATWSVEELRAVAVAAPPLGLASYFGEWHKWGEAGEQEAFIQAARYYFERANAAGVQRMDKLMGEWRKLADGDGPPGALQIEGLDTWLAQEKKRQARRQVAKPTPNAPAKQAANQSGKQPAKKVGGQDLVKPPGGSTEQAPRRGQAPYIPPTARPRTHTWQTFDEVAHPDYGRGIIISTTTTTRGRELKVQFADGNLKHFRDDDPALVQG